MYYFLQLPANYQYVINNVEILKYIPNSLTQISVNSNQKIYKIIKENIRYLKVQNECNK